jgi:hypothetical protein
LIEFDLLQAYFGSIETSATPIIRVIRYRSFNDDTVETERTKEFLLRWLRTTTPEMLRKFLMAVMSQPGIIDDQQHITVLLTSLSMLMTKVVFKMKPASAYRLRSSSLHPAYLTPKFTTCTRQIELAGWPSDKTEDDFVQILEASLHACDDSAFTVA